MPRHAPRSDRTALRRCLVATLALLAVSVCVPAAAGERGPLDIELARPAMVASVETTTPRAIAAPMLRLSWQPKPLGRATPFVRDHLLPNFDRRLDGLAPTEGFWHRDDLLVDRAVLERWSGEARRHMQRATEKALESYLLEETTLRQVVENVEDAFGGRGSRSGSSPRARGGTKLDLGISHGEPELRIRHRSLGRTMRLSVGTDGALGVRYYDTSRLGPLRLVAKFEPQRERFSFHCRLDAGRRNSR